MPPRGPATPPVRVVLISTRNPLNIGAAARAMSNFGFLDMALVDPYDASWQEARSAVGASAVLANARVFRTVAEAVAGCRTIVGTASLGNRELKLSVKRLEEGARLMRKAAGPVALLFGSEKYGLSNDDLSRCDWLMRIPTRAEHESMNLGQAVALCLYELIRNGRASTPEPRVKPATAAEIDQVTVYLEQLLRVSGYSQQRTATSADRKLRRLLRRMRLSSKDAVIWMGMLRQIGWKLGASGTMPDDKESPK
ncbi:MAG: TrmJ/YjtD family RNA methyltransferase [Bryobacteraceae bacterium]